MDNIKEEELKQFETIISRQLHLMNLTKYRASKRRTTSHLINQFHSTYSRYKEKGGKAEVIKGFADRNMFLDHNLNDETYQQRIVTLFSNKTLIDYHITGTLKFSRWDISVSQLQDVLTLAQFEEITKTNHTRKCFFYDSDFYVIYDHRKQAFGIGKDADRMSNFQVFNE